MFAYPSYGINTFDAFRRTLTLSSNTSGLEQFTQQHFKTMG